jgi:hypothetical protein
MSLKPEASVMAGLAIMGVVYGIHSNFTPPVADIKGLPAGNKDVDKSERQATAMSIGVVSAVSLLAKDPTIFVLGSIATVGLAFLTRHATWTESATGLMHPSPGQSAVSPAVEASAPQMTPADITMSFNNDFV